MIKGGQRALLYFRGSAVEESKFAEADDQAFRFSVHCYCVCGNFTGQRTL